jgi:tRNA1Val (adenine37-N6)-methyltransferase
MSKKPVDTKPFHLKPFSLQHHRSTMKVGTDAMILGVWANVEKVSYALDIGTGCGIISLLIASRSNAKITAIDIDNESINEANENFQNSPYSDRLQAVLADLNNFSINSNTKFDLIVSNPPFFVNDLRSMDEKRKMARHSDNLSYSQLCEGVNHLISSNGKFCIVLPYEESRQFVEIAKKNALFQSKQFVIFPREGMLPNRINFEFSKNQGEKIITEKFTIRNLNDTFTSQYIDLLKDYYLNLEDDLLT